MRRTLETLVGLAALVATSIQPALAVDGPHMVRDLRPGDIWNSQVQSLTVVGSRVFFAANDGTHGQELFVSDGTFDGSHMARDIWAGDGSALVLSSGEKNPNHFTVMGERVFFAAREPRIGLGIYVSDGTDAGTKRLMRRRSCDSRSGDLVSNGTLVAFASRDANGLCDLFTTDGTLAGTTQIAPGIPGFRLPTAFGRRIFFAAGDDPPDAQLWKSDAAAGGVTKRVRSFRSGVQEIKESGGRLFLAVNYRLWRTNGTVAGTVKVDPNTPKTAGYLTNLDGKLLFVSSSSHDFGRSLWRTNGRTAGIRCSKTLAPTCTLASGQPASTPVPTAPTSTAA